MFHTFGRWVRRAWPLFLAVWGLLLLGTWLAAPPWDEVAQDKEFAFLPANSPSRVAEEFFARAFPEDRLASNIVLVMHRPGGESGHLDADRQFISDVLEPSLHQIAEAEGGLAYEIKPSEEPLFSEEGPRPAPPPRRSILARIRTPNAPGVGALLVSPDGEALLVVVELTTEFLAKTNWPTIERVEDLVRGLRQQGKVPRGLEIAMTGSAVIGRDHSRAEMQSVQATRAVTVILVVVLLIAIYRAPLLALIPLITVYVAVEVSLRLLAILGKAELLTIFQGIQIFITILAYGAGVDYCLFLTARYREELDRGADPGDAVAAAVGGVGAALVASAATVMAGIGMMAFAQFGKFHEAGIVIPFSLFLVLCATLTFSPSLLRLAGRWAFWPHPLGNAERAATHPDEQLIGGGRLRRFWDRVGRLLLRRPAAVWLVTVALMAPFAVLAGLVRGRVSYDFIGDLPPDAPSMAGTRVLLEHFPAGTIGPVSLLLVDPHVDFSGEQGQELVRRIADYLRDRKEELELADIRTLTVPLGITKAAAHPFAGSDLSKEIRQEAARRAALQHYVTNLGERAKIGTRLDLILAHSPFSRRSVEDLQRIEDTVRAALPADLRPDARLYAAGTTASVRDLAGVIQHDEARIEHLVLGGVLVILLLLLRRLVIPVYLLASVLFSYYVSLGVAFALFWLLDPHGFTGMDWKVGIFLFTILVAVGEDYNIFLMTRVDEESRRHGPLRGVTQALTRTGPIISSCGIIMAGTFAAFLAGSLAEMKQLGFALAFGVLLDTFVVRPILVPAFLVLLRHRPSLRGQRSEVRCQRSER